ncbi:site-2 protease family protein [Nocardia sp. CA-151230]|uniref:site-2 protease family protein n=1 Tax=Nocardia sp. CA-151230 TaxID=3239982 RepID=UPI003D8B4F0D
MPSRGIIPLGRIAGVPIAAHWSALATVGLFTWILATHLRGTASTAVIWAAASVGAVVLICCLLAHELAHSIVARRNNIGVARIELWLLGGASELTGEPRDARTDLRVAIAGPTTSLAIGGVAFVAATISSILSPDGPVTATLTWLATVNVVLAVFNLIPGAPLDGGRVLRAVLWQRGGDRLRAETGAARSGQFVGLTLGIIGIAEIILLRGVGGLWLMLLGWFLYTAANSELTLAGLRHQLGDTRIGEIMTPAPQTVPAEWSVSELLHSDVTHSHHRVFPVVDTAGRPQAVLAWADLLRTRDSARADAPVTALSHPFLNGAIAHTGDLLGDVAARVVLRPNMDAIAVVDDAGRLTGIVTATDLTLACNRSALGLPIRTHQN